MGKIKFKILNLWKKNNFRFLVSLLVAAGITLPLFYVSALWGLPGPGSIADAIGKAIGNAIASFILAIPMAILIICSTILAWAIDPWFIRLPYTSGGVVAIGWPIARDLANMGIVLALVVIGLSTALRLEEYRDRKILIRLIMVAFLINFTPVILGFIIDFSNILMNFFLSELTGAEGIWRQYRAISDSLASDLGGLNFFNPVQHLAFFAKLMIVVIFDLVAAIIFLLFAVLFIMRRVILWMLVIFSPIAFLAWVLPNSRKLWDMWWNQFIQWSLIGFFAAFFLYLGEQVIVIAAAGGFISEIPAGGGAGGLVQKYVGNILNDVLPYLISLIFLLFGFFIALSASAFGSSAAINLAKKGTQKAGRAAGAFGVGAARGVPAVSRAEETIRRRMETMPVVGRAVGGVGAYERERTGRMDTLGKPFEKLPPAELRRALEVRPITRDDNLKRARLFDILKEKGQLHDTERAYLPMTQRMGLNINEILERRPDWAPDVGETVNAAVARMDPEEFRKNVQAEALASPEVVFALEMDDLKFREFERKGKQSKKHQAFITAMYSPPGALPFTPTPAQVAIMAARYTHMTTSPNWRF